MPDRIWIHMSYYKKAADVFFVGQPPYRHLDPGVNSFQTAWPDAWIEVKIDHQAFPAFDELLAAEDIPWCSPC